MSLLDLPFDVLTYALPYLQKRADLLHFGATCREVHELVAPRLTSSVKLERDAEQVTQFCAYMLADAQRPLSMHELVISGPLRPDMVNVGYEYKWVCGDLTFAPALAEVIECAKNLESLSLLVTEDLLEAEPRLAPALTHLPRLAHVHLSKLGPLSYALLRELHGLRSVKIDYAESFPALLQHSQTTLEHLRISQAPFQAGPPRHTNASSAAERVLASRRRLEIVGVPIQGVPAAAPGARRLVLWDACRNDVREANERSPAAWPALDHVKADLYGMYNMALRCPVAALELDLSSLSKLRSPKLASDHLPALVESIRAAAPAALALMLALNSDVVPAFFTRLTEAVPDLKYLKLSFTDPYDSTRLPDYVDILKTLGFAPQTEDDALQTVWRYRGPDRHMADHTRLLARVAAFVPKTRFIELCEYQLNREDIPGAVWRVSDLEEKDGRAWEAEILDERESAQVRTQMGVS